MGKTIAIKLTRDGESELANSRETHLNLERVYVKFKVGYDKLPAEGFRTETLWTLAVVPQPHVGQLGFAPVPEPHL